MAFTKKIFLGLENPEKVFSENTTVKKPLKYFLQYIDVDTFYNMTTFTNMRGVETKGQSFKLESDDAKLFFKVSMLISTYNLPRIRINWARKTRILISGGQYALKQIFSN